MAATHTAEVPAVEVLDPELARASRVLRSRATDLRSRPTGHGVVDDVVARAERRRAAELELASWALAARAGLRDEGAVSAPSQLQAA